MPTAWAVISFFTTVAPKHGPHESPRAASGANGNHAAPLRVSIWLSRSATTRRAASVGLPSVHRYERAIMARSGVNDDALRGNRTGIDTEVTAVAHHIGLLLLHGKHVVERLEPGVEAGVAGLRVVAQVQDRAGR